MNFTDLCNALDNARKVTRHGDNAIRQLLKISIGRLRLAKVDHNILCQLKRELKAYDMHRAKWK